ncbi:transposase [Streptomyces sp. SID8455]|nr:transposase [Streptomyces sp. SID8455]
MVDTLILDLLDPEETRRPPMAMRDYSDEFKADAVALYESTPGATYKSIAADLGINRNTLRNWVLCSRELRSGVPDAARDARTVVRIPDLFRRDFAAPEPGIGYMGDITCLPLENGEFLNLATVLDRFSRKVVGWSISTICAPVWSPTP